MCKRISDQLISAIIGGVVGAVVVLFVTGPKPTLEETAYAQLERENVLEPPSGKFKTLEVEELIITNQAMLRDKDGKAEVVIKDGSVLVENVILAKKLIGRQIQGHAVAANRVFLSPDDLVSTPMEQWRFFVEIGASIDTGGEIVVRSVDGSATVNKATTEGAFIRTGFDPESRPQIIAFKSSDRSLIPIIFELSEQQKKMLEVAP